MPFRMDKFGNAVEITVQEFQDITEQRVNNLVAHRIADYQQRKAELENQPTYGKEPTPQALRDAWHVKTKDEIMNDKMWRLQVIAPHAPDGWYDLHSYVWFTDAEKDKKLAMRAGYPARIVAKIKMGRRVY